MINDIYYWWKNDEIYASVLQIIGTFSTQDNFEEIIG